MDEESSLQPLDEAWDRALFVVAHPDDIEFGPASLVARWTTQSKEVTYLLITHGEAGIDTMPPERAAAVREQEQINSARVVGVTAVEFLSYPDGTIEYGPALRRDIAGAVRRYRPELVLTNSPHLTFGPGLLNSADHRAVCLASLDPVHDAGNCWIFSAFLEQGLAPWAGVRTIRRGPQKCLRGPGILATGELLAGFALFGSVYILPAYLGQVQHYNAEQIGTVLAWTGLPQLILIPLVPKLMQRIDARYLAAFGLLLFAYSSFMNTAMSLDYSGDQLWIPNIVRAIGQALTLGPLSAVTLGSVAKVTTGFGPSAISRENRQRRIEIDAPISGRPLGPILADARVVMDNFKLPEGYRWEYGPEIEQGQTSFDQMYLAVGLAVLLIYMLLAAQFESYVDPLIIMTSMGASSASRTSEQIIGSPLPAPVSAAVPDPQRAGNARCRRGIPWLWRCRRDVTA